MKAGASHIYQRLLRGEVTAERYIAVVKRAVSMRLGIEWPETLCAGRRNAESDARTQT